MKSSLIAALVLVLVSTYSFVYACRGTRSVQTVSVPTPPTAQVLEVVGPLSADATIVCKTVESVAPVTLDVDLPVGALGSTHVIHVRGIAIEKRADHATTVETVKHTAKVAATLGRAFVTTIGAVWGSLMDALLNARAALV